MWNYINIRLPASIILISKTSSVYSYIVILIWLIVILFVYVYLPNHDFANLLTLFVVSILVILNSGESILIRMFGWDILGLTSLLLVLWYPRTSVNERAIHIILMNSFSDFLFICLLAIISSTSYILAISIVIVYTLLGMTKSAVFPFHYWLPLAIDAPTPVSCLLHSSTLVVAGYYIYSKASLYTFNPILLKLSLLRYCLRINLMLSTYDIKKFIAYSTIINLGIIIFLASLIYFDISYLHIISHRLYKSALFLLAGYLLMYNFGNQDIRKLSASMRIVCLIVLINRNMGWIFVFTSLSEHILSSSCLTIDNFLLALVLYQRMKLILATFRLISILCSFNRGLITTNLTVIYCTLVIPLLISMMWATYVSQITPLGISSIVSLIFIITYLFRWFSKVPKFTLTIKHISKIHNYKNVRVNLFTL